MLDEIEQSCPYCGEPIALLVDSSAGDQSYVEDCQVCCRPIEVTVSGNQDDGVQVSLRSENDG